MVQRSALAALALVVFTSAPEVESADSSAQLKTLYNGQAVPPICNGETTSISILESADDYTGGSAVRGSAPTTCIAANIQAGESVVLAQGRADTDCKGIKVPDPSSICIWDQTALWGPKPGPIPEKPNLAIPVGANCLTIYHTASQYNAWGIAVMFVKNTPDIQFDASQPRTQTNFDPAMELVNELFPDVTDSTWMLAVSSVQNRVYVNVPNRATCTMAGVYTYACALLPRVTNPDYGSGNGEDKYTYDLLGNFLLFGQHLEGQSAQGDYQLRVYEKADCEGAPIWSSDGTVGSFLLPKNCADCSFEVIDKS